MLQRPRTNCFLAILTAVLATGFAARPSQGGIVSDGTRIRDVQTGLEYLRLRGITLGQFPLFVADYNSLQSTLPAFPGYRVAESYEMDSLLNSVGLPREIAPNIAAYAAAGLLLDFFGPGQAVNNDGSVQKLEFMTHEVLPGDDRGWRTFNVWKNDNRFEGSTWTQTGSGWNGASAFAGVLLVKSFANGTDQTPLGASEATPEALQFNSASGDGIWFDLAGLGGDIRIDVQGANILDLALPVDYSDSDNQVTVDDLLGEQTVLNPGDVHAFSTPLSSFVLRGVDGVAGGASGDGGGSLPFFFRFDQSNVSFTATIATVPEPATVWLAMTCFGMFCFRRRTTAPRARRG